MVSDGGGDLLALAGREVGREVDRGVQEPVLDVRVVRQLRRKPVFRV